VREGGKLPSYGSLEAAGADLSANLGQESYLLKAGERAIIPTGLILEIPTGFEGQARSRSGLAVRYGVIVLNSPGTIDSDYRGEICVILHNSGKDDFEINDGDRIAQLVIAKVEKVHFEVCDTLSTTERDTGRFGSTGG